MRRMTTALVMVARCRVYSAHVQTKDLAVTGAQLCLYVSCKPKRYLFGFRTGRRSAIKQFWWADFNASSDSILVDAADGRFIADAVDWLFGEVLLDVRSKPADQIYGGVWQSWWQGCCGRWHAMANCWEISMLCRWTVVSEPLDAVRRHLPFKTACGNTQRWILFPLEPAPVSVLNWWRPFRVAEYWEVNYLVGR